MLAHESPVFLAGAFETIASCYVDHDAFVRAFTTGEGIDWGAHDERLHTGALRLFRSGYEANLVQSWLPALDGVVEKLQAGARVAAAEAGVAGCTRFEVDTASHVPGTGYDLVTMFDSLHEAGFSSVRVAARTPFNVILEARP